jgi:hypothetical protein
MPSAHLAAVGLAGLEWEVSKMAPLAIAAIIGAGMGLLRGMQQQKQEAKDRVMEAEIARWSPWTGMAAQRPKRADMMGSVMQGGLAGASFGQQFGGEGAAQPNMSLSGQGTGAAGYNLGVRPMVSQLEGYNPYLEMGK